LGDLVKKYAPIFQIIIHYSLLKKYDIGIVVACCLHNPPFRNKPQNPMHPPDFAGYPTELPVKLRNPEREVFQLIPMGDPMSGDVATDHRGLIAGTKGMFTCEVHVGKPTKSGISWGYHDANRHENIEAKGKINENIWENNPSK